MEYELVAVESFLDHVKGEIITDADTVKKILDSEWSAHVIRKHKQAAAEPDAS